MVHFEIRKSFYLANTVYGAKNIDQDNLQKHTDLTLYTVTS